MSAITEQYLDHPSQLFSDILGVYPFFTDDDKQKLAVVLGHAYVQLVGTYEDYKVWQDVLPPFEHAYGAALMDTVPVPGSSRDESLKHKAAGGVRFTRRDKERQMTEETVIEYALDGRLFFES